MSQKHVMPRGSRKNEMSVKPPSARTHAIAAHEAATYEERRPADTFEMMCVVAPTLRAPQPEAKLAAVFADGAAHSKPLAFRVVDRLAQYLTHHFARRCIKVG